MREAVKQKQWFFPALFLIALLLTIPSLRTGIFVDDYYHRLVMLDLLSAAESSKDASLFGLFSFLDGNVERTQLLIEQGVLPWWTLSEVKYTFFRPLSELSIYLDYRLWPASFELMHAQSSFWFAVLAVTCAAFFSFISSDQKLVLLASLFFVLDGTHGLSIAWLAARNALLAAAFGMLSVYCVAHYVRAASLTSSFSFSLLSASARVYFFAALIFLLASLAAGEIGLSSCAFIVAYVFFLGEGDLKKRIQIVLPFVLLALLWLGLRSYLDFGAYGTGAYQDPFHDPLGFLSNFLENINLIYFALWSGIPVELLSFLSLGNDVEKALVFLLFNGFLLLLFFPFWIKNKRAHFYLAAMLLASVPVSAGEIQSRVLIFVSIPALAFCAECLIGFWISRKTFVQEQSYGKVVNGLWLTLLYLFSSLCLLAHLLLAPVILLKSQTLLAEMVGPTLNEPVKSFQESEHFEEKVLILVDPPLATAMGYFPIMRKVAGESSPRKMLLLSSGLHGLTITRVDEYSLELEPEGGFFVEPMDKVLRSDKFLFQLGERIELSEVSITILELNENNYPQKVLFRFKERLESDGYDLRCWQALENSGELRSCVLPAPGETIRRP